MPLPILQLCVKPTDTPNCPLCGRPLAEPMNRHHLLPLSQGGKGTPTVMLHRICHSKIHSVLSEKELRDYYHNMERLKNQEEIARFIKWIRKKDPGYFDRNERRRS